MIARSHHHTILLTAALGLTFLSGACQKVPLLAPSGSTVTLTSSQTAVSSSGTAQLIAQVLEPAGTPPHSGTHVIFTTSLGSIEPSEVETDINGRAEATFRGGGANGTAIISASSGGASTGANPIRILVGTAGVGRVNVGANPTIIPAQGGSSVITAQVFDINGNALPAAQVAFSTTAGTLDATAATTDGNGFASVTLRTSVQADVTANVGAQGGTTGGGTTTPPSTGGGTTGGGTTGGGTTTPPPASSGQASGTVRVGVAGTWSMSITLPTTPPSAGLPAAFVFVLTAPTTNASPVRSVTVDWGDGIVQDLGALAVTGTGASNTQLHTYQSPGAYTIRATLVDSFGTTVPVSTGVVVNPKPQPTVSITPSGSPQVNTTTLFTVAATATTGFTITSVQVDFGDGTTVTLPGNATSVQHQYTQAGPFTVTATATDSSGASGSGSTRIVVGGQPPGVISAPTNLVASAVSSTQIDLAWTASISSGVTGYLVERCTGTACTNFVQIGTPTGTTFNNTGLTTSTTYRYRVRARDASGNVSPYSSVETATTP